MLLIIGLLLLTGALLAAAPPARAGAPGVLDEILFSPLGGPAGDTHTWDGGAGTEYPQWSNELNWVGNALPSDGDALEFPAGSGYNATNDHLDDVGAISVGHEMFVDGSALGLGADLTLGRDSVWAVTTTTLEDDVSVVSTVTPEPTPESTPYAHLGQDIEMLSPTSAAHALTVENYFGYIVHHGSLTGADAACSLTKKGPGTFVVGGPGGKGSPWGGTNTWAGPTDVQAGLLTIGAPGALSSHTAVDVDGGASVTASFPDPAATDVWSNEFTGSGRIDIESAALTMTAASDSFFGAVEIDSGSTLITTGSWPADTVAAGLLRGSGTVGFLTLEHGGAVSPAVDDYEAGTLDGGGMALLKGGSSYVCDVTDAEAAAGLGHDLLALKGDVTFSDTSTDAVTVVLRSGAGGTEGPAPGFDKTASYRWTIVTTPGSINDFSTDAVTLDTTAFVAQNPVGTGTFALEVTDHTTYQTLDVVFTPLADFETGPAVGDGGDSFAKGSKETVAWEMDAAPPAGSVFKVVADDPGSATNVLLATVPATSATEYTYDWTIAQGPSTGWHVIVQLWSGPGDTATEYRTKDSQSFDILAASYTITVTAGDHGAITPATGLVTTYSDQTYTITPDEGYHVAEVLVDGSSVGAVTSYQFAAVQADRTLAASFVPLGMPSTTVSGASSRWSRTPVTLTFTGHPGEAGIPIACTEYKVGEGAWTEGATVTIRGEGETRVWYRSVDEAGAVQDPPGRCLVRIDTRRPQVVARSLRARSSQTARLRYMVTDPLPTSGSALVRCVVRDAKGKVMTRSSAVPVGVNEWLRLRISTWGIHAPGAYTIELRAKDRAGNWQKGWTRVRLTIR